MTGSRGLQLFYLALRVIVTFAALYLVFRSYEISALARRLADAQPIWLVAATALAFLQMCVLAWRWQLIHALLTGVQLPLQSSLRGTSRSFLYGQLLPAMVGMDAIRIACVRKEVGLMPAFHSVAADRLIGLVSLVVLVAAAAPFSVPLFNGRWAWPVVLVFSGGLVGLAATVLWPAMLRPLPFVGTTLSQMAHDLRLLLGTRSGAAIAAISLVAHLMSVIIFAAITVAVGGGISLLACLLFVPQLQLIVTLPVSLGGWGVREAVVVSVFTLLGADPVRGALASVCFGLCNPIVGMLGQLWDLVASSTPSVKRILSSEKESL